MSSLPIVFSHLSPLITYTPADAWTHDAWGSNTTTDGATATFDVVSRTTYVYGRCNGNASWDMTPPVKEMWGLPEPDWRDGSQLGGHILRVEAGQGDVHMRQVTLTNGQERLSVQRVMQFTALPEVGA